MSEIILNVIKDLPYQFIIAVIATVCLAEYTKIAFAALEKKLEEKKGKEIKFFDHTKIIFVIIYSLISGALFILSVNYSWKQYPLYVVAIIGTSVTGYEMILKKIQAKLKEE